MTENFGLYLFSPKGPLSISKLEDSLIESPNLGISIITRF